MPHHLERADSSPDDRRLVTTCVEVFHDASRAGVLAGPAWFLPKRRAAMARFARRGYPTRRDEDWRFTNLAPVLDAPFRPALCRPVRRCRHEDVGGHLIPDLGGHRLVFHNGFLLPAFSRVHPDSGVVLDSLAARLAAGDPTVGEHLSRLAAGETNPFVAMNTGFLQDGAFVHIPTQVEAAPVHLVFLSDGSEGISNVHVRNLIVLSPGSRGAVVETYATRGPEAVLTNSVTEVVLDEEASLEHVRLLRDQAPSSHLGSVLYELRSDARLQSHSISSGARLSRTNGHVLLNGSGAEAEINGLYLGQHEQLLDHHWVVEHARPRGISRKRFHGVLAGQAHGVFHGRVRVHPDAQHTDAEQTNRNLLLSDRAVVNTKPQLEIRADDVRCTHGATVGQLNEDAIFYLRTRGIGREHARRMLVRAFAGEAVSRIENPHIGRHAERLIDECLAKVPELCPVTDD